MKWAKYEFKRSPLAILADIGKWLLRLTAFVLSLFGGIETFFSILAFIFGWQTILAVDFSLLSYRFQYYTTSVLNIFLIALAIFLAGAALFYIGFWKIEHDLW